MNKNLFSTVPRDEWGFLSQKGEINYKKVVNTFGLSNIEVAKAANIKPSSVRYNNKVPKNLVKLIEELISIFSVVSNQFDNDKEKTILWFKAVNPLLGGVSPLQMIILGKSKRLMEFIDAAVNGELP